MALLWPMAYHLPDPAWIWINDYYCCHCSCSYSHPVQVWALTVGKQTEMLATGGRDAVVNLWHDCTAADKEEAFRKEVSVSAFLIILENIWTSFLFSFGWFIWSCILYSHWVELIESVLFLPASRFCFSFLALNICTDRKMLSTFLK